MLTVMKVNNDDLCEENFDLDLPIEASATPIKEFATLEECLYYINPQYNKSNCSFLIVNDDDNTESTICSFKTGFNEERYLLVIQTRRNVAMWYDSNMQLVNRLLPNFNEFPWYMKALAWIAYKMGIIRSRLVR